MRLILITAILISLAGCSNRNCGELSIISFSFSHKDMSWVIDREEMADYKIEIEFYNKKSFLDRVLSSEPRMPSPVYAINGRSELLFQYCDKTIVIPIVDDEQISKVALPNSVEFKVSLQNGLKKALLMRLNSNGRESITLLMENGQVTSY